MLKNPGQGIGGKWTEIGWLQFGFLIGRGLRPSHYFLDVGCGSLRGGVNFIGYLEKGHYFGLEKERALIYRATSLLKERKLWGKEPTLIETGYFDMGHVPGWIRFDFALAQSVFTHLEPHKVEECLCRVMPRLAPDGAFYATFFQCAKGMEVGPAHSWRKDEREFVNYPLSFFRKMARELGIKVEYIGSWGHPVGQKMLCFTNGGD
jgi:SAM-dependent methyltransferase